MSLSMWLALCVGVLVALQPVVNARLAQHVGTLPAATLSFVIGTTALLCLTAVTVPGGLRGLFSLTSVRQVPPILFVGGFIGAGVVYGSAKLIPRLGAAGMLTLTISGQLLASAVADHFGLFGLAKTPLAWPRVVGLVLLLVGARLALR
jgi:transporter family-2 protein